MSGMQMGPPPGGDPLGFAIVVIGTVVTAATFMLAIRATFRPGESEPEHPKRSILRTDR